MYQIINIITKVTPTLTLDLFITKLYEILGITCETALSVSDEPSIIVYGEPTIETCPGDHRFESGLQTQTIVCTSMGNRHPRHSNCAGNVKRKPYG